MLFDVWHALGKGGLLKPGDFVKENTACWRSGKGLMGCRSLGMRRRSGPGTHAQARGCKG